MKFNRLFLLYALNFIIAIPAVLAERYNVTNLTAGRNIYDLAYELNLLTTPEGLVGHFILFAFFILLVIVFKHHDNRVTFLGAAFMTSIAGAIFWSIGLIGWSMLIYPLTLLLIFLFYKIFGDQQ